MRAMRDGTGFVNGMGYVIKRSEYTGNYSDMGTSMGVLSQGQTSYMPLPEAVINDNNFKNNCVSNYNYCLIYMSNM